MPFHCFVCGTKCDSQKRYDKHCQTAKHIKNISSAGTNGAEPTYICECGKGYQHKPSLCRHQRTCTAKQNQQHPQQCTHHPPYPGYNGHYGQPPTVFQQFNIDTVNHTVHNTNINNPVFNFNIYLNEQCRDAICIEEFCNTLVNRIKSRDDPNVSVSFIDNRETFDHVLGNLRYMNSVKRPIQTFQGEIVEKSRDDWRALSLERLNSHVTGITSQVNWAKFTGLPQPITGNDLLQNMIALKAATQIHPPLKSNDMCQLKTVTKVSEQPADDKQSQLT